MARKKSLSPAIVKPIEIVKEIETIKEVIKESNLIDVREVRLKISERLVVIVPNKSNSIIIRNLGAGDVKINDKLLYTGDILKLKDISSIVLYSTSMPRVRIEFYGEE